MSKTAITHTATSTTIPTTQVQTPLPPPSTRTPTLATATAAGHRDLETRNQVPVLIDLTTRFPASTSTSPSTSSPPPRYKPSSTATPMREIGMGRHYDEHDRSPVPTSSSTMPMRDSMSIQRPSFYHTNTEYHTYHQSSSSSSLVNNTAQSSTPVKTKTSSNPNSNSNGINNGSQIQSIHPAPYRDHPPTKEEYPHSQSQSSLAANPYNQSFPPRQSSGRRSARNSNTPSPLPLQGSIWDSARCRLWDLKCRMCCKEGAIGRGLMVGWVLTTVGFLLACGFWKGELFTALDDLSKELYSLGYQGQLIFGFLIFLTTIPPLPLYSTLMVLCGYTFGVWEGFVVSYIASLTGAILVFIVSRTLLRDVITKSLQNSPTAISLLHIIPSNPHLLLLIRIAPYPYNLLNVILASSPALTLKTYTACTALSLCKLVLHTWIGAGLHSLSELHGTDTTGEPLSVEDQQRQDVRWYSTCFGVVLCISLFFYLTHLAKRALAKAQSEHEAREIRCPGQGHVFLRGEDA